ncbi:hypothetical protein DAI22_10g180800 [Oryza sativa Japonica Group]|nr:hypothetical protein DAI22_10g180800 [Oryza sativa Japonica Group]
MRPFQSKQFSDQRRVLFSMISTSVGNQSKQQKNRTKSAVKSAPGDEDVPVAVLVQNFDYTEKKISMNDHLQRFASTAQNGSMKYSRSDS